MSLGRYKKKRNFGKTPEPKGETVKLRKSPIFVVHEHWARSHHFDFRLEIEGVLKSWAVPKGPPRNLGEKRLAIKVEDHPLEYASFKGEIPEGQYGAGKVEIWDQGRLEVLEKKKDSIHFSLFGKRLKGEFSLFQPPSFEKKNWLLMKK
ncbi:MAG TPA: DNA polymerase ligase N-terminal domain-containing protein [Candidatus Bathyarchaeia archaeon]|nr:DNA polymerase ligase N-terminal domain-containing protein [Candidatus Bathyarchaeia archaeon]